MKLSAAASALLASSVASTLAPSASAAASAAKSSALRRAQTAAAPLDCPATPGSSSPVLHEGGTLALRTPPTAGDPNGLCTLIRVAGGGGAGGSASETIVPVGRSYAGRDWEGVSPLGVSFGCFDDDVDGASSQRVCEADLPAPAEGESYRLTSFSHSLSGVPDGEAARLLLQSTFGPTRASIQKYLTTDGGDPAAFVRNQMDVPMTSHRAYFRTHAQGRVHGDTYVGRVRNPCEWGSRWRKWAFSREDWHAKLTVEEMEPPYILRVNGMPRLQVSTLPKTGHGSQVPPGYDGELWALPEPNVGGVISFLGISGFSNNPEVGFVDDPFVLFGPGTNSTTLVFNLTGPTELRPGGHLNDPRQDEVLVHKATISDDEFGRCTTRVTDGKTDIFGMTPDGTWWLHDPVIDLKDNTPGSDDLLSLLGQSGGTRCSAVSRSSFNEEHCFFAGANQTTCASRGIVCPGLENEVANDPLSKDAYDVLTNGPRDTTGGRGDFEHQKWTSWINIVMGAEDQLRQRVAWAFYQTQVLAGGLLDSETEPYLAFYDIFVRNAFGNFRDILKEISFNPLMAGSLTYLGSKSSSYVGNSKIFPDENYAREIMQLFSIGLWELNPDGTQRLDSQGEPIPTYTNDDIMDMARAWTGFVQQSTRGNMENWSGNRIDPMQVNSPDRDHFPKIKVGSGGSQYIGDGLPLCVDAPGKPWLRKGTVWQLLGRSSAPDLLPRNMAVTEVAAAGRGWSPAAIRPRQRESLGRTETSEWTKPAKIPAEASEWRRSHSDGERVGTPGGRQKERRTTERGDDTSPRDGSRIRAGSTASPRDGRRGDGRGSEQRRGQMLGESPKAREGAIRSRER